MAYTTNIESYTINNDVRKLYLVSCRKKERAELQVGTRSFFLSGVAGWKSELPFSGTRISIILLFLKVL